MAIPTILIPVQDDKYITWRIHGELLCVALAKRVVATAKTSHIYFVTSHARIAETLKAVGYQASIIDPSDSLHAVLKKTEFIAPPILVLPPWWQNLGRKTLEALLLSHCIRQALPQVLNSSSAFVGALQSHVNMDLPVTQFSFPTFFPCTSSSEKYAHILLNAFESLSVFHEPDLDLIHKVTEPTVAPYSQSPIRMLVLDVDGVMTDGGMYYTETGQEIKKFSTRDGIAIKRLLSMGIEVAFLSSGLNASLLESRARTLGVERLYVGKEEKTIVLNRWLKEMGLLPANIAYIGDDINDLGIVRMVGLSACPADAVDMIRQRVQVVLQSRGGEGCVREFVGKYICSDEQAVKRSKASL